MADLLWILEKDELGKIIDKLPGLSVFVRNHANDDLEVLDLTEFLVKYGGVDGQE